MSAKIHYMGRGATATACGKSAHLAITYVSTWQDSIDCLSCLAAKHERRVVLVWPDGCSDCPEPSRCSKDGCHAIEHARAMQVPKPPLLLGILALEAAALKAARW